MSTERSFRWMKWLLLLALAAGGVAAWYWYGKKPNTQPLDFKTACPAKGDIIQSVTANGQISPVKNVSVGSQVSGLITDIYVDYNSRVTNGQVVARIDPSTYKQTQTQMQADLENSLAGLELAELNHRRNQSLLTNALISQSEFDKSLVELHQAQAVVHMREATLNKAKVDVERTTIYAPIDGVVISRSVDAGQTVAASFNAPVLFNIANDLRQMRIEAMVSEADVGGVEEGQPVTFTVEAFPERPFQGVVTQVRYAPITNQNVVNYTTVVEVKNDDLKLRPGMTATAYITTAQKKGVLRIPNAALRFPVPTNAVLVGVSTNAAQSTNTNGAVASAGDDAPTPPWVAEGRSPNGREEVQKWMDSLPPEQRAKAQAARERRRAEGGGRGGGAGGGQVARTQSGPGPRKVYLVEKTPTGPVLRPVTIKIGISDAGYTEVLEGLKETDVVAVGINYPQGASAQRPGSSPFGGPFGGFRPR